MLRGGASRPAVTALFGEGRNRDSRGRRVHRDLKPSNVMLVGDMMVAGGERVKLLDFGIAKLNKTNTQEADPQTRAGVLLGTPRYMSPEQCLGRIDIDGKSDVYSLGVMMFEMLTGQMPFKTPSEVALVAAHIYEQPTPLRELCRTSTSPSARSSIRCCAKRRTERPSMLEVARRIGESAPAIRSKSKPPRASAACRTKRRCVPC